MDSMRALRISILALAATALLVPPSAFGAPVSVGHSGWNWGNPLPQGASLRALEFVGTRGYAAGDFGTVLRTDDAGQTWVGIATGIIPDLRRIRVLGGDTVIIGGGCTLRRSDDGGQSFNRLEFTASELRCTTGLASFAFPSAGVGYLLLDDGTILRTTDGGQRFSQRTAVPGTGATGAGPPATPTDIFFTSADTGVAVTKGGAAAGRIYRTTDAAGSWTLVATLNRGLNGLYFTDASTGYAVGDGNALSATSDGGASWSPKALAGAPGSNLTSIRCADPTTCLMATEAGDRLLRTTDGGATATAVTPSTAKVFAAAFASASRAVAVGEFGTTVTSDDAGVTFDTIGGRIGGRFSSLRATSQTTAYAPGGDGRVARTTDGGATWDTFAVSTPDDILDVSFPTAQIGYALDVGGLAFRTDNGGGSWQILNTGTEATKNAILAPDENTVLLIGPIGMRRSTNAGDEFAPIRARVVRRARLTGIDAAGEALFAFGPRTVLLSGNDGASWKKLRLPRGTVEAVDFVTSRLGYLLQTNGRVFQTRNRGRRWVELLNGTGTAYDIAFGDAKNGWLALRGFPTDEGQGFLLRTSDGGRTWRPQLLTRNAGINGIAAVGANGGFALADPVSLFASDTGGDQGADSALTIKTRKRTLRKTSLIRVTGKLDPADGGERVVVAMRAGGRWTSKEEQVASNGTFTTTWRVRRTSAFVAQWRGDDDHMGDGSAPLKVKVVRRR
jgi:photosystem II stability/assembly factor-like uncharacterized protein